MSNMNLVSAICNCVAWQAGGGAANYARYGEAKRLMLLLAYSVAYV